MAPVQVAARAESPAAYSPSKLLDAGAVAAPRAVMDRPLHARTVQQQQIRISLSERRFRPGLRSASGGRLCVPLLL